MKWDFYKITKIKGFFFFDKEYTHNKGSCLEDILISHFLVANYTCKPEESHLGYLRCILALFEVMLRLKINLSKSVLIPIGEVSELNNLVHFLGCGVDYPPLSYLGLPLGAPYKCKAVWEPMVESFQRNWRDGNINCCLEGN